MSYDLFFYKQKGQVLSEVEIGNYLSRNLTPVYEDGKQWFFENEDTDVYFSVAQNKPEDDPESIEMFESFVEFDNTHFTFNLNFIRPNFFGLEAFAFVEKMINDLDLYIMDMQSSEPDIPRKISANEMLETWSHVNLAISANMMVEHGLIYVPLDRSDGVWHYNFQRKNLQAKLGESYFVPRIFFMRTKSGNNAVTLSTWTHHIPMIIPTADYFMLIREYKKFFKPVKEMGLISYDTLIKNFGDYFEDFDFKGCKIIHPDKASQIKNIFNKVKFEYQPDEFGDIISMDKLSNAKF